jgi:hypothetical protein
VITAYHRPTSQEEALQIYFQEGKKRVFILGSARFGNIFESDVEVIDLQELVPPGIQTHGDRIAINGFSPLFQMVSLADGVPVIRDAITREYNENARNNLSVSFALYQAVGHSILANVLLAYDTSVVLFTDKQKIKLEDWCFHRKEKVFNVILEIEFAKNIEIRYETVSKTPRDLPELIICLAKWKSGRRRLVIGNRNLDFPQVVFDGTEEHGIIESLENACSHLFTQKTNSIYYTQTSKTLLKRLLSS